METITHSRTGKSSKWLKLSIISIILLFVALFLAFSAILLTAKLMGPPKLTVPQASFIYASNGKKIGETNQAQHRYWTKLNTLPSYVKTATISIEDKHFYTHHGFDFVRMGGAILADIKAGKRVQGASTITQQYAKNLYLNTDRTWTRKISEAFYTIRLEMNYSKNQILEGYLNTIYYGHGSYGIQAASKYYFGKDAKQLSLAETSMLVGIPKGPSIYSPLISEKRAKQRQKLVLQAMQENGYITKKQMNDAQKQKLHYVGTHASSMQSIAPYFQDVVKKQLTDKLHLSKRTIDLGGLRIYTTLDPDEQKAAETTINQTIPYASSLQVGFTAMNPETGYVTALVGGRNYEESAYNRVTQAVRQPGSTMKPLLYYAALQDGFTPASMLKSERTTFHYNNNQSSYEPENFNNVYANKEVTMAQALAVSDNIYAVKTLESIGNYDFYNSLKHFGLTTSLGDIGLSTALGTPVVHVMDMVNAYSTIANDGKKVTPVYITKVEDYQGNVLYQYKAETKQILDPSNAFVLTQMMTGMFDKRLSTYATVTGASMVPYATRQYAGKSGSTDTDSWMIGYTPQLTAGIWTGYDQGKKITLSDDKKYAKKIWIQFMETALQNKPIETFSQPKNIVSLPIDIQTGKIATSSCGDARLMYFKEGTQPTAYCGQTNSQETKPKQSWLHKVLHWFH